MLHIETVSYSYNDVKALNNVSLRINKGELIGLVGSNGAGKTTLIKCITGLLKPDSGSITISQRTIDENPVEYKKKIGYVPENPFLYKYLTGFEYLKFISDIYTLDKNEKTGKIEFFLDYFNLSDKKNDLIGTYSHGMVNKISICAALLHSPEYLILDEPLIGLDPDSSFKFKELLNNYKKEGCVILFSSHILEVVEKISDKIAIIDEGKIAAFGTLVSLKNEVKKGSDLEEIFMALKDSERMGGDSEPPENLT